MEDVLEACRQMMVANLLESVDRTDAQYACCEYSSRGRKMGGSKLAVLLLFG